MTDGVRARWAAAFAVGALVASTAYVVATIYEQIVAGPTDPFLIVRDVHFGYYHRAGLAAWTGGAAALACAQIVTSSSAIARIERLVTAWTIPWTLALAVLAYLFP